VIRAYGGKPFKFGREYIIRSRSTTACCSGSTGVAEAAIATGVARTPWSSKEDYVRQLESRLSRTRQVMHMVFDKAKADPSASSSPRARLPRSCGPRRSSSTRVCRPVLLGEVAAIETLLKEYEVRARAWT